MLESALERRFAQGIRRAGGRSYKIAPTDKGIPDRLVLWPGGRMQLVELKTDTGRLSEMQKVWHGRAAQLGTNVVVLYGAAAVDAWIESKGTTT